MNFHISLKRILAGSSLGALSLVTTIAVSMFMLPFIVHNVGDRAYGIWIMFASFVGYYGLLDFGLSVAVTRFISNAIGRDDISEMNDIVVTTTVFFVLLGFAALLISVIAMFCVPYFLSDSEEIRIARWVLLTIGITSIFQFGLRGIFGVLYAKIRHDIIHTISMIKLLARTALIIYFLYNGYGIISVAFIVMVTEIIGYIVDGYYAKKVFKELDLSWKHFTPSLFKPMMHYGAFSVLNQISEIARTKTIPFIVSSTVGLQFVVFYAVAIRLLELVQQAVATIMGVLTPVFSSYDGAGEIDKIKDTFETTLRVNLCIGIMFVSGLALFSEVFITVWMGEEYNVSALLCIILGFGYIFGISQESGKILSFGVAKHQRLSVFTLIQCLLSVAYGIIGGMTHGLIGVAVGLILPLAIYDIILRPYIVCQTINFSLIKYYLICLEIIVKLGGSCFIFYYAIKSLLQPSFIQIFILASIMVVFLLPVMFFCLDKNSRNLINNRLFCKFKFANGAIK